METKCAYCNVKLKVPDEYAGRKVKCPKCKQSFEAAQYEDVHIGSAQESHPVNTGDSKIVLVAIISGALAGTLGFVCGAILTTPSRLDTERKIKEAQVAMQQAIEKSNELETDVAQLRVANKKLQQELKATKAKPSRKLAKSIEYKTVAREDVSYLGTPRMVFRVVVQVDRVPPEDQLEKVATQIWEDGNKSWKEFTVFMYLPDMDTKSVAYAVAEFRPYGLKEFRIQEYALYETKWKSLEEEKKRADEEWKKQKQRPEVKDYKMILDVNKIKARQIRVNINTDFPNGTNLHIWIKRTYYEKGKSEKYAGDIFTKDMTVKDGKIDLVVYVNDSLWYNEYYEKAKKFSGLIDFPGIERISPRIEISVLFSPRREQSKDILKILGTNGEFVKGIGAERTGNFTTYSVSQLADIPFKK